jgi:hypothetical protein
VFQFVELDEAFDPIGVCFGGFWAHMAKVDSGTELVEEFWFAVVIVVYFHGERPFLCVFAVKRTLFSHFSALPGFLSARGMRSTNSITRGRPFLRVF